MKGTPRYDLLPLSQVFDRHVRRPDPVSALLLGNRFGAIPGARDTLVNDEFLDTAGDGEFTAALRSFYEAVVPAPLHLAAVVRRAGMVRFALNHLLHCLDPLPTRLDRILMPDGPYHVAGL